MTAKVAGRMMASRMVPNIMRYYTVAATALRQTDDTSGLVAFGVTAA